MKLSSKQVVPCLFPLRRLFSLSCCGFTLLLQTNTIHRPCPAQGAISKSWRLTISRVLWFALRLSSAETQKNSLPGGKISVSDSKRHLARSERVCPVLSNLQILLDVWTPVSVLITGQVLLIFPPAEVDSAPTPLKWAWFRNQECLLLVYALTAFRI